MFHDLFKKKRNRRLPTNHFRALIVDIGLMYRRLYGEQRCEAFLREHGLSPGTVERLLADGPRRGCAPAASATEAAHVEWPHVRWLRWMWAGGRWRRS
jgi:hypothetical protein